MRRALFLLAGLAALSSPCAALTAADFQVYSLGALNYAGSDFEGRAGAAGDVRFQGFSLGAKMAPGADTLFVGGSAVLLDGTVHRGGVRAGGDIRIERVTVAGGLAGRRVRGRDYGARSERSGFPGDADLHASVSRELLAAADALAALPANGATLYEAGVLRFIAPGGTRTVFRPAAGLLSGAGIVAIVAPAGTQVVVDATGSSAALWAQDFRLEGGIGPETVIFNFSAARILHLGRAKIPGTVLAPRAATVFESGAVNGNLYVGGLVGNGQVNAVAAAPWALAAGSSGSSAAVHAPPAPSAAPVRKRVAPLLGCPDFDGEKKN